MNIYKSIPAFVLMITTFGASVNGSIIEVPADFSTIQQAITAATAGDVIVVSPGTYMENINFNGKAVTLRSTDPLDATVVATTIIDANGAGNVVLCENSEGLDTVLEGFTITGGNAGNGGGMLCLGSSPTVSNCTFIGNTANRGGGFDNVDSNAMITDCTFIGNMAIVTGGGMYNFSDSSPTITNCRFIGNTAQDGGGMLNSGSDPTVINCTFIGNTASNNGGGLYNLDSVSTTTNCTFSENMASNLGGGLYSFVGTPTVTNCILWGNSPDEINNLSSALTISHSNINGSGGSGAWDTLLGTDGGGNIDFDPMYVDADGADNIAGTKDDDLRLLGGSPSIDAGNNTVPQLSGISTDLDGNVRFIDDPDTPDCSFAMGTCGVSPIVDMGSYEFAPLSTVPTTSQWGLVSMAIFLTIAGTILLRRNLTSIVTP